ncbi:putative sugar phosphate/phosphate translocator [Cucumis melo var. makuwa]|uniref:Sugar phosphate/phosphate translocator n=1 Tax=Cucumis melo var. makuwa TaxID=1194695 RepID=A0A5A7TZF6_CUCMM|nr:putative sugar phosphate/phosphate translocator [Cucumis melo var. makuwa]
MQVTHIQFNFWIFFSNALCALALNFSIFLVIGRTGAVTIRVAGVDLKDWILIALSTVIFPESTITGLNIIGYAIGEKQLVRIQVRRNEEGYPPVVTCTVKYIQRLGLNGLAVQPIEQDWKLEKKSTDIFTSNSNDGNVDEEAPLLSSRLSHIGRMQVGNHNQ